MNKEHKLTSAEMHSDFAFKAMIVIPRISTLLELTYNSVDEADKVTSDLDRQFLLRRAIHLICAIRNDISGLSSHIDMITEAEVQEIKIAMGEDVA